MPSFSVDPRPLVFADLTLDRRHRMREDADALQRAWDSPQALLLPLWGNLHPLRTAGDGMEAVFMPTGGAPLPLTDSVFLGFLGDHPCFAGDLAGDLAGAPASEGEQPPQLAGLTEPPLWSDLRSTAASLPAEHAGLLSIARAFVLWHRRHRFCAVCGAPSVPELAGHQRRCSDPACAALHFPRTDPAVIMLVEDDAGRVLLGRQAVWPPGMVSALAGFVEPGETLEQAVAREVMEETGIAVEAVRYVASQPWPFPSSLMIGFTARATSHDICIDPDEMDAAYWFTRDEVRAFRPSPLEEGEGFAMPGKASIARFLLEDWLARS